MTIPVIDDRIRYVGVSALRSLNAKALRELEHVLVLQVDDEPVAVLIPYAIYLEIQKALWPSSLLPSLEKVLGSALSQEEDARAVDLTAESNEGINSNPDFQHSTDSYIQPPEADGRPSRIARTESGHEYMRGEIHECGVSDCPAAAPMTMQEAVAAVDEMHETPSPFLERLEEKKAKTVDQHPEVETDQIPFRADSVIVRAMGTDPRPRGAKFSRVDPNQEPVVDDLDEDLVAGRLPIDPTGKRAVQVVYVLPTAENPLCSHCGKPNEKELCSDCFMAGHRENCLVCPEGSK